MKLVGLLSLVAHLAAAAVNGTSVPTLLKGLEPAFQNLSDCYSCQNLVAGLRRISTHGELVLQEVLAQSCIAQGAEDRDVCEGTMANGGPGVYHALKNMKVRSHTSETFCHMLFGFCQPETRPYSLPFPSPRPATSRPPPSGKAPIEVVHFSDTHVDLEYEEGSNTDCGKPMCCRSYTLGDAPGNNSSPCGPWGNTQCDPPQRLHESMLNAIADINPAFSIYTGDVVAHNWWHVTKPEVLRSFNSTYDPIEKKLGMVYSALGNHDTAPAFQFPSDIYSSKYSPQWAYGTLAEDWFSLTGTPSVKNASKHGSYSAVHPNSNLRIISYNSIFYYKQNFWAYTEPIEFDPDGQLQWIINELQEAEDKQERVWLIAHIPFGNLDHFRDHSHYLDQIVQRYHATIAALFFGHTHKDEFQVSYSDYTKPDWTTASAIGYIAPSLTPWHSGSPTFRVYKIDPVTFGVLDYTQYIANITDPSFQVKPEWKPYYSAKANYGSKLSPVVDDPKAELTPAFWHNVTEAMEKDHSIFQDFWGKRVRDLDVEPCERDCISNEICALRGGDLQYSCYTQASGTSLYSKRDGDDSPPFQGLAMQEHECDHSEAASLFAKIALRAKMAQHC